MSHDRLNLTRKSLSPFSKSDKNSFLTFDDFNINSYQENINSRYIIYYYQSKTRNFAKIQFTKLDGILSNYNRTTQTFAFLKY